MGVVTRSVPQPPVPHERDLRLALQVSPPQPPLFKPVNIDVGLD